MYFMVRLAGRNHRSSDVSLCGKTWRQPVPPCSKPFANCALRWRFLACLSFRGGGTARRACSFGFGFGISFLRVIRNHGDRKLCPCGSTRGIVILSEIPRVVAISRTQCGRGTQSKDLSYVSRVENQRAVIPKTSSSIFAPSFPPCPKIDRCGDDEGSFQAPVSNGACHPEPSPAVLCGNGGEGSACRVAPSAQNFVTSLKWNPPTFIAGTTISNDSSPAERTGSPSISTFASISRTL